MGLIRKFHQKHETPKPHRTSWTKSILKKFTRLCRFEQMEPRQMLSAAPTVNVGSVYYEPKGGDDTAGNLFYISWNGGAPNTKLTEIVINTDKNNDGQLSARECFFHTAAGGQGVYGYVAPNVLEKTGVGNVTCEVLNGGMQLKLNFENFTESGRVVLKIDVDEMGSDGTVSAVAEGWEFDGSHLTATFTAPHYYDVTTSGIFKDNYNLSGTNLNLPPDNYMPPSTESQVVLTAGVALNFTQTPLPITLSGNVYLDPNANNKLDSGEHGIQGVTLSLFKLVDGSYVDTGITVDTDINGHYQFSGEYMVPGTYRVFEKQPTGYMSVGDAVGTVDGSPRGTIETKDILRDINLDGGENSIENNYFETLPAMLSGHVYHDANNNGVRDTGEAPLAGVTVNLLDSSGNATGKTTTTNNLGYYEFTSLMPGVYGVAEVQPDGYRDGLDAAGNAGGTAMNPGDKITGATLLGGQSGENYDFGELLPCSISGRVFLDLNGDAFYDSTVDTLLVGVTIRLLDGTGNQIDTRTTDNNGEYAFNDLNPGKYSVSEDQPDYLQGDSLLGPQGGTRVTEDLMKNITIPSGVNAVRYDFYELPPATLSGFVYVDANNDGFFDNEESPIAGVTVTLLDANGNSTGRTTTTDTNGFYSFTELEPGTYGVAETQPTSYLDGLDTAGTVGGTAHNPGDKIDQIVLIAGDKAKNYNFGELRPASISGKVFVDLDIDNAYDPGETLLSGVTMRLLDSQGNEVATVKTGSDGTYAFNNLYPGQYSVVEEQPANYLEGGDQVGTVGTETRGILSGYDKITSITLGQNENGVNYDFWEVVPAKISGYVFQDGPTIQLKQGESLPSIPSIRDGMLTADDTRLAGVRLKLCDGLGNPKYDDYGNEITTVTDQNGHYEFTNLKPGSYSVVEVMPTGYIAGVDTAGSLGGYVVNTYSAIPADKAGIWAVNSDGNSIVQIELVSGSEGTDYNFSVVKVAEIPPYNPPTPPDINVDFPRQFPGGEQAFFHPGYVPQSIYVPMAAGGGAGGPGGTTWHLSVINGGQPRSDKDGDEFTSFANAEVFDPNTWKGEDVNQGGQWTIADENGQAVKTYQYGLYDAIPVVGDWNGDGTAEIGVFLGGYWFIDLNGNGQWDENDLWAKLGQDGDQPVAGDWDGDGKADIGIFGPAWIGDRKAIESEPGLPDSLNLPKNRFKNVPPDQAHATIGYRSMKRTMAGKFRSDLIDHVFEYGTAGDRAVVGDWTGTGINKIGIFRNGTWYLDIDGDGRWSAADVKLEFGREGDLPVVGDWTGDGVTKLGVYRAGTFILDTNSNRELDATDKVFELGTAGDKPFAGDFDGKGIDTVGVYHDAQPKIQVPKSAIRSINAK